MVTRTGTLGRKKAKKTRKVSSGATGAAAAHKARIGRAPRGRDWDPTLPEAQAPAYLPEVNVPRPYTSRYPISNEAFEALKSAAPKAKLPKVTAERARDKGKKTEQGQWVKNSKNSFTQPNPYHKSF